MEAKVFHWNSWSDISLRVVKSPHFPDSAISDLLYSPKASSMFSQST